MCALNYAIFMDQFNPEELGDSYVLYFDKNCPLDYKEY